MLEETAGKCISDFSNISTATPIISAIFKIYRFTDKIDKNKENELKKIKLVFLILLKKEMEWRYIVYLFHHILLSQSMKM